MMNDYTNLESVLQKVNNFISLRQRDKHEYTEDFNRVRDFLLHEMMEIDNNFKRLFNGPSLAGSYADNLKVSKPDEFDLVFHMKVPDHRLVDVSRDPKRPGNVLININPLLDKIKNEQHNKDLHAQLSKLVNEKGYLVQPKFQSWIESIVTRVLQKCSKRYKCGEEVYEMDYSKTGPAHKIKVTQGTRDISIDFVPGLIFDKDKWPAKRKCPSYAKNTNWIAVPKPIKAGSDNFSFQASYVDTEREIIQGKYNLKNCIRMFKKIRDNRNTQNLKSYYIKTVFLWETDVQSDTFWNKNTLTDIFLHMFEKIVNVLESGNLPFFWDKPCNMFLHFTKQQLNTMRGQWKAAYQDCLKFKDTKPAEVLILFLTKNELEQVNGQPIEKLHRQPTVKMNEKPIESVNGQPVKKIDEQQMKKVPLSDNTCKLAVDEYKNLESELQKINNFITLRQRDKQNYTEIFKRVRDFLLHEMKETDKNFDRLYNGRCLTESNVDCLKVSNFGEFKFVLHMKVPDHRLADVQRDPKGPGNILINMNPLLDKIKNEQHNKDLHAQLSKFVNEKGYLVQTKFQSWMESIVTRVLQKCSKRYKCGEEVYEMDYSKTGPAHKIKVTQGTRDISINFVPGLIFDKDKWPAKRKCPRYAKNTIWIAVPNPIKAGSDHLSFRASFIDTEREIIQGKHNLQNCIRMFKKIHDNRNTQNLKSYYIKTVFLWETDVQSDKFWSKSTLTDIFLHMFGKIMNVLESENLPYFWDKSCNMFLHLTKQQLDTMRGQWKAAHQDFLKFKDTKSPEILKLFLNKKEMGQINAQPIEKINGQPTVKMCEKPIVQVNEPIKKINEQPIKEVNVQSTKTEGRSNCITQ